MEQLNSSGPSPIQGAGQQAAGQQAEGHAPLRGPIPVDDEAVQRAAQAIRRALNGVDLEDPQAFQAAMNSVEAERNILVEFTRRQAGNTEGAPQLTQQQRIEDIQGIASQLFGGQYRVTRIMHPDGRTQDPQPRIFGAPAGMRLASVGHFSDPEVFEQMMDPMPTAALKMMIETMSQPGVAHDPQFLVALRGELERREAL